MAIEDGMIIKIKVSERVDRLIGIINKMRQQDISPSDARWQVVRETLIWLHGYEKGKEPEP